MINIWTNFNEFFSSNQIFLYVIKYHASCKSTIRELLRLVNTVQSLLQKLINLEVTVLEFFIIVSLEFLREWGISNTSLDAPYSIIVLLVQVTKASISITCKVLTHCNVIPDRVQVLQIVMFIVKERLLCQGFLVDIQC